MHFNIRSLTKKIDQCRILFDGSNIDVITVSETWLKSNTPTEAISINGFQCTRLDRKIPGTNKKRGGGVLTYINQKHAKNVKELTEISETNTNVEALWTRISMTHCKDVVICNIYRPPQGKLDKALKYLEECLGNINTNKDEIYILGDLNVDVKTKKKPETKKLAFFIKSSQLNQLIKETTRITKTTETTLDLIMTNSKYITQAGTLNDYLSDHQPVYAIKKKNKDSRTKETFTGRSYRHYSTEALQQSLKEMNWNDLLDLSTPDTAWSSLYSEIIKEVDRMCPVKTFTVRSNKPEWITNDLMEQMRDRDYFYKKAKKTKDDDDWNIAKHLRNVTNSNIRRAKAEFIINELESSKDDLKKFWRVIKRVFPGKDKSSKKAINLNNDIGN